MTLMPVDPPDGTPFGEKVAARPEPADRPPAAGTTAPSPEVAARENARNGRWAMNDYFDGWVLLGADNRPVMRNDGSQVGFFFHDAQRLAGDLAARSGRAASPESTAEAHGPAAAAWLASRRALAPLDSGLNDDWDPQVQTSYFATITKMARLLAYDYVRTTEPEEAVRRAVSVVLGNPTYVNGPRTRLWVPGKYDAGMVKLVADTLFIEAVGADESETRATGDAFSPDSATPSPPAVIKTSSTSLRVDARERQEINRALRNKGSKLRRERLESDSLNTTPPKAPPGADIDANIAEALKKKGNNQWFYDQVNDNGPWDYKRQGKDFEEFGNFNYGATGAALGYSEAALLRMAGWNHARNNPQGPENGVAAGLPGAYLGIGGVYPFGDDLRDQLWIRRGYQYYMERR